jgi:hypothetical protein
VKPTEHIANPASTPKTGLATLRALLHVEGTGACGRALDPSRGSGASSRRRALVILSVFAVVLGPLALASAPALAAAPETPTLTVESKVPSPPSPSTEVVLHGVLNPAAIAPSEAGSYEFLYKAGATCAGGTPKPVPAGLAVGIEHEPVSETLTGLTPNTEYTVCLIVRNGTGPGHESSSAPVTFKTALPPEKPETISPAKLITATTATFEGVLNPKAAAAIKAGWYFAYNVGASCVGGSTTPSEAEVTVKAASESKGVTGLQPHAQYTFCLVATNAAGEAVPGNGVAFETKPAPPEVTGETTALPVKATEATLEAQVNPNNESTTYRFEYSMSATGETLNAPVTTLASATVLGGFGNQTAGVATGPALAQDTTYYYRVLATNSTGTTPGTVKHFKTAIAPETPEKLEAEPIGPTTATLKGVLDPTKAGEAGTYEFAYRQSAGECQRENPTTHLRENEKVSPEPAGTSGVSTPERVHTDIAGLLPGAQYTFCLIAHNSVGETAISSPITFTTLSAAPAVVSESASSVESGDATLEAQISPDGAETKYHFEYGTTEAYGHETAEGTIEGTTGTSTVRAHITGLTPNTTYHYRAVATNSLSPGGIDGPDKIFTTPIVLGTGASQNCPNEQLRAEQPYGLGLPDCRAYEMVSPAEKNGSDATDPEFSMARISASGEAIVFRSAGSFADPVGSEYSNQFLSRRGSGGWSTQSITPPFEPFETAPGYTPFAGLIFTPELTEGVANTLGSLTSETPKGFWELYLADFATGSYQWVSNAPPGVAPFAAISQTYYELGASTDLSHVVFGNATALYEWVDGKVMQVGVANNGDGLSAQAGAVAVGGFPTWVNTWHAVSSDGSRIVFTSPNDEGQVYVRENAEQPQSPMNGEECTVADDACTVEVSASQRKPEDSHGPQPARYWGASADGSKVIFTSNAELTDNAYTGPADNAANLYEYDLESGKLTDLTVDANAGDVAEGAAVQGVVQISEEGSYVYFVAKGDLAGDAKSGAPNLYVSHDGGAPTFIATLNEDDEAVWNNGPLGPGSAGQIFNIAAIQSNGTHLAFVSTAKLKTVNFPAGYDNTASNGTSCPGTGPYAYIGGYGFEGGPLCSEVFEYDAITNQLACASCNPSGARPIGASGLRTGYGVALPSGEYQPNDFSENGTLFFGSDDALVPHDSNGLPDVYEYENGHIYPISDVAAGYESFFLGASPSGNDVFFASTAQLVPQDVGNNVEVYDARVGGGFPAPASAPPCDNGDSCKPPPVPQPTSFGAPGSATFSGPGNITPAAAVKPAVKPKTKTVKCKKGFVKKKDKCVKKAKPKKKAKKSTNGKGSK